MFFFSIGAHQNLVGLLTFTTTERQPSHTAQGLNTLGLFANNGSLPTRGVGRLPGPLSDQLWRNLKNAETPAMVLIEGEFPLTWFLTTALLSKRETKVGSVYTWTDDTAEGVYTFTR